jgi:alkylation response protein AidB-like acyl-CoA dehydrogenase
VLDGRKLHVPALLLARRVLIPATTPDGPAIFLVDPRSPGVAITPQRTSTGEPLAILALAGVRVAAADVLGGASDSGAEQVAWLHQCALVATAALQVGVAEKALALTAEYVRDRVQFGVPIGSFQAVQHRAADCYIDLEAMRWVTWRAAWQLSRGLPATRETLVAKFWAAEAGARIAAAAQHLHGGIGSDVDYPVHRYFLWAKALELSLGAASPQLVALGRDMAAHGPEELA